MLCTERRATVSLGAVRGGGAVQNIIRGPYLPPSPAPAPDHHQPPVVIRDGPVSSGAWPAWAVFCPASRSRNSPLISTLKPTSHVAGWCLGAATGHIADLTSAPDSRAESCFIFAFGHFIFRYSSSYTCSIEVMRAH